jgi:hypothetical protein
MVRCTVYTLRLRFHLMFCDDCQQPDEMVVLINSATPTNKLHCYKIDVPLSWVPHPKFEHWNGNAHSNYPTSSEISLVDRWSSLWPISNLFKLYWPWASIVLRRVNILNWTPLPHCYGLMNSVFLVILDPTRCFEHRKEMRSVSVSVLTCKLSSYWVFVSSSIYIRHRKEGLSMSRSLSLWVGTLNCDYIHDLFTKNAPTYYWAAVFANESTVNVMRLRLWSPRLCDPGSGLNNV